MTRAILYCAILFCLVCCKSYRSLEGRVKPVYFTSDPSIFKDSLFPEQAIYYPNLISMLGSNFQVLELKSDEVSTAYIHKPAIFNKGGADFLIYPGEHILIKGDYDNYTLSTVKRKKRRDRELLFFKTFRALEKYPVVPRVMGYTLQSILDLEQQEKFEIAKAEVASKLLFDSLLKVFHVSNRFKRLTKNYLLNRYQLSLQWVYKLYNDTLKARNLYLQKVRQLVPSFNSITKRSEFNYNVQRALNDIIMELFPENRMWSMPGLAGFRSCFDSVENNFTGLSRDYLLSRIMWRAYSKGIAVPAEYSEKYQAYSINKSYNKIVYKAKFEREKDDADTVGIKNILLATDGKTKSSLEEIFAKHAGKIILVDLWTSWCVPCLKEIPYVKQMVEKYPQDKIVFLGLSLDKSELSWKKALRINAETTNQYLLMDAAKTSFYKRLHLVTIPRFLVFDRAGNIINSDAPWPSDPALGILLDGLLYSTTKTF